VVVSELVPVDEAELVADDVCELVSVDEAVLVIEEV
jgi:hypothetical protein